MENILDDYVPESDVLVDSSLGPELSIEYKLDDHDTFIPWNVAPRYLKELPVNSSHVYKSVTVLRSNISTSTTLVAHSRDAILVIYRPISRL